MVRYLALISLTVFFASGLVVLVDARTEPVVAASARPRIRPDPRRPPLQPDAQ